MEAVEYKGDAMSKVNDLQRAAGKQMEVGQLEPWKARVDM